jgi:hypothetical protein
MSVDKAMDFVMILLGACCVLAVLYFALQMQKIRAESEIKTVKLEEDAIEKNINSLPLNQLVNDNNAKSSSSGDTKS